MTNQINFLKIEAVIRKKEDGLIKSKTQKKHEKKRREKKTKTELSRMMPI